MIGGVCGGLADYFNVDVVLIRIAFVLLLVFGGGGFLAYIILWIVIPIEPLGFTRTVNTETEDEKKDTKSNSFADGESERKKNNTSLIAGIVLILIGLIILFDRVLPFYHIKDFWPMVFVILGIFIIKPEILGRKNENIQQSQNTNIAVVESKNDDSTKQKSENKEENK